MIAVAVVVSLIMLGEVAGVREGSLICAICTGFIIGWFFRVCPMWEFAAAHRPAGVSLTGCGV